MRKRNMIWSLLAMMMVAVFSTTFMACEEENKEENGGTSVIGVWSGRSSNGQFTLTFKNNNIGTFIRKYTYSDTGVEVDAGSFTYTMETKENGLIVIKFNDSHHNGENEMYYFVIEDKTMSIYTDDYLSGLAWVLTKQS